MCEAAANTSPSPSVLISLLSFPPKEKKTSKVLPPESPEPEIPSEWAGLTAPFFTLSGRPKESQRLCDQSHWRLGGDESTASPTGTPEPAQTSGSRGRGKLWRKRGGTEISRSSTCWRQLLAAGSRPRVNFNNPSTKPTEPSPAIELWLQVMGQTSIMKTDVLPSACSLCSSRWGRFLVRQRT